jgi:hypothetical protein
MTTKSLDNKVRVGSRIRLVYTDDSYTKLKPGDIGVVTNVCESGDLNVFWDSGSSLSLIEGIDKWHVITADEDFISSMEQYVGAGYNFLRAWETLQNSASNTGFDEAVEETTWPFTMSFDEYVAEMHHHLDTLKEKLKELS